MINDAVITGNMGNSKEAAAHLYVNSSC